MGVHGAFKVTRPGWSGYVGRCKLFGMEFSSKLELLGAGQPNRTNGNFFTHQIRFGLGFNVGKPTPSFRAELAETGNPGDGQGSWAKKPAEVKTNPSVWLVADTWGKGVSMVTRPSWSGMPTVRVESIPHIGRVDGNQTILVWNALASRRRHIRDTGPELEALVTFAAPCKSAMNQLF